jgi:cytochrome b
VNAVTLTWKWFISASILVTGLLVKAGAPLVAVVGGIAIAAALTWKLMDHQSRR